jgi:hypothetical protein
MKMTDGHLRGSGSFALRLTLVACVAAALARGNTARAAEPGEGVNACGCRKDSAGLCYCDRKAKCGCPGECEPKGCEEKRNKELEKEIELETKKAKASAGKERAVDTDEGQPRQPTRAEAAAPTPKKHPEHHMTIAERRELQRLLDLYVAEHPEARQKSIEETRAALTATEAHRTAN